MGHYTRFELTISDADPAQVGAKLAEINSDYFGKCAGNIHVTCSACGAVSTGGGLPIAIALEEPIKWYDHEENMVDLSRAFPAATFVLSGEGEEHGDVWEQTYTRGVLARNRRAKITMEDE